MSELIKLVEDFEAEVNACSYPLYEGAVDWTALPIGKAVFRTILAKGIALTTFVAGFGLLFMAVKHIFKRLMNHSSAFRNLGSKDMTLLTQMSYEAILFTMQLRKQWVGSSDGNWLFVESYKISRQDAVMRLRSEVLSQSVPENLRYLKLRDFHLLIMAIIKDGAEGGNEMAEYFKNSLGKDMKVQLGEAAAKHIKESGIGPSKELRLKKISIEMGSNEMIFVTVSMK